MPGQTADVTGGVAKDGGGQAIPAGVTVTNNIKAYTTNAELTLAGAGEAMSLILIATTDCHVEFSTTAATVNSLFLPANTYLYVGIAGITLINVVQSSSGGNLHVAEIIGGTRT